MFSRANKDKPNQTSGSNAPKKRVPPSIISADLVITGNLVSEGEIQVDGTVKGDIQSKELLIGETALIEGEIMVETLRVHGKVIGQIKALNVSLAKSAHVIGDILHDNLSIETGAFLEGHCKRLSKGEFTLNKIPELRVADEVAKPAPQGQVQAHKHDPNSKKATA
jgi:cytoskeletal protein CcmA (bactofilin family)